MTSPAPVPPRATVVICVYTEKRWDDIVAAVGSVRAQDVSAAEVLVVVDHNPALLDRAAGALGEGVRVLANAHRQGLSGARNTAVAAASGDIVVFLDDDAAAQLGFSSGDVEGLLGFVNDFDAGDLGEIRHFRGRYLQDWGDTDAEVWRFERAEAGSGALGDLAAHVVDLARYLVGEIDEVGGFVETFIPNREVDDAVEATVRFANGAVGTLEATRLALGRRNAFQWEINGTKGSLAFDMERLNELQVFRAGDERTRGFTNVLVSEASHPFWEHWWPPGHIVGWGDTFVHELHHFLAAIAGDTDVAPHGATFEDGYRAAEVCDAIVRSGESGRREAVVYRALET